MAKNLPASAGDIGDSGRFPGEGHGSPQQYLASKPHRQSLTGYTPKGQKESDTT